MDISRFRSIGTQTEPGTCACGKEQRRDDGGEMEVENEEVRMETEGGGGGGMEMETETDGGEGNEKDGSAGGEMEGLEMMEVTDQPALADQPALVDQPALGDVIQGEKHREGNRSNRRNGNRRTNRRSNKRNRSNNRNESNERNERNTREDDDDYLSQYFVFELHPQLRGQLIEIIRKGYREQFSFDYDRFADEHPLPTNEFLPTDDFSRVLMQVAEELGVPLDFVLRELQLAYHLDF
ncbi:hypothetical protein HK102_012049, partial [Quaeritorhiza haematococci]